MVAIYTVAYIYEGCIYIPSTHVPCVAVSTWGVTGCIVALVVPEAERVQAGSEEDLGLISGPISVQEVRLVAFGLHHLHHVVGLPVGARLAPQPSTSTYHHLSRLYHPPSLYH